MPQWVLRQRIPCGNALRGPPTQATDEIFSTEGTYGKAIDVRAGAFGGHSWFKRGKRERVSPAHTDPRGGLSLKSVVRVDTLFSPGTPLWHDIANH